MHTLNTVLWFLLQRGLVKLENNPHFYPEITSDLDHHLYSVKPWPFTVRLDRLGKLDDLKTLVASEQSEKSDERRKHTRRAPSVIHTLTDHGRHVILKGHDEDYYKHVVNVWKTDKVSSEGSSGVTVLRGI